MQNEVTIEGYIVGEIYTSGRDTLFRLACPRAGYRPTKMNTDDGSDYITVRLPYEKFGALPLALERRRLYRIRGFLQSREYQESLERFLEKARNSNLVQLSSEIMRDVTHNRVTTEIVAESVLLVKYPSVAHANHSAPSQAPRRKAGNGHTGQARQANPPDAAAPESGEDKYVPRLTA